MLAKSQDYVGRQVSFEVDARLWDDYKRARAYCDPAATRMHVAIFYSPLRRPRAEIVGTSHKNHSGGHYRRVVHPLPLDAIPPDILDSVMS